MATQVAPSPMEAAMIRASNVPNSSRTAYSVGCTGFVISQHESSACSGEVDAGSPTKNMRHSNESTAAELKFLHQLRQAWNSRQAVNCHAPCWAAAGR